MFTRLICVEEHVRKGFDKQGLLELLERPVDALGFELVDLDVYMGRRGLLRVYIDRKAGSDEGVTLSDCELVSGQLSAFLDVEDPLPGSYVLEISSPGLDRRLRTLEHFERFVGQEIKVELHRANEGRKRLRGLLTGIDEQKILLDVDGEAWRLDLADIAVARLVPPKSA